MFTLPTLSYSYDALEPHFDAQTMELHHTKHHQTYVDKLNAAIQQAPELTEWPLEKLLTGIETVPEAVKKAVRNHGGGHHNHSLWWEQLAVGKMMSEGVTKELSAAFGSVDDFKKKFTETATNHFGSGWAWLVKGKDGKLAILSTPNQDSPLMEGHTPILGLDVWEHAYYLKYQNRRPEFIAVFWNVVDWDVVEGRVNAK
jgi:superoxide dismutase, Fe-Mn family